MRTINIIKAIILGTIVIVPAAQADSSNLCSELQRNGVQIEKCSSENVDGIVLLKGDVSRRYAAQLPTLARELGFTRVANLTRTRLVSDDEEVGRVVERTVYANGLCDQCRVAIVTTEGEVELKTNLRQGNRLDSLVDMVKRIAGVKKVRTVEIP